jgi:hypothetical protein
MAYNVTADGRDLSKEEWRKIPGFRRYLITKDGDVKNVNSGKLLTERETNAGSWAYCVWTDEDKSTYRAWQSLVWLAFPELKPEPIWKPVVGFEHYVVSKDGKVMKKKSRHVLHERDGKVRLKAEGVTHRFTPQELVKEAWG